MVRCGKISRRCFVYDKDSKIPYRNGDDPVFAGAASAATFINIGTGSTKERITRSAQAWQKYGTARSPE